MKGFAAANKALERQAAQVEASSGGFSTFRFRLKPSENARVVFLSNEPEAVAREHTVPGIKRGFDNVICLNTEGDDESKCPFCAAGNLAPVVGFFTVLHLVEYTSKRGEKVTNPIRTLAAKSATLTILGKYSEKNDGLRGAVFDVSRSNSRTSPNVGDLWMLDEVISKSQIMELNPKAKPLDFDKELNRWTYEQMEEHASKVNVGRDRRDDNFGGGQQSNSFSNEDAEATTTTGDIDW